MPRTAWWLFVVGTSVSAAPHLVADLEPAQTTTRPFVRAAHERADGRVFFQVDAVVGRSPALLVAEPDGGSSKLLRSFTMAPGENALAAVGPHEVFIAAESESGQELWTTDGTPTSTALLSDLAPGEASSFPSFLTNFGNEVFFITKPTGAEGGLYATDGVTTRLVLSFGTARAVVFGRWGGKLVLALQAASGVALSSVWVSDGTVAGTTLQATFPVAGTVLFMTGNDNRLFFNVDNAAVFSFELATQTLVAKASLPASSDPYNPTGYLAGGPLLHYVMWQYCFEGCNGAAWSTADFLSYTLLSLLPDVFESIAIEGTQLTRFNSNQFVEVVAPGRTFDLPPVFTSGAVFGGRYYVTTDTGLWVLSGLTSPTWQLIDSGPATATLSGGEQLLARRSDGRAWALNGDGVLREFEATLNIGDSEPRQWAVVDGQGYFVAQSLVAGRELHRVDALGDAGLFMDLDHSANSSLSDRGVFLAAPQRLLFQLGIDVDALDVKTRELKTLTSATSDSNFVVVADQLVNATRAGLSLTDTVSAVQATVPATALSALLPTEGGFVFVGTSRDGIELWKTDLTPAGTREVADVLPGVSSSWPEPLASVGSTVLFSAFDPVHGREVWVTDGTATGTRLLADVNPGSSSSFPGPAWVADGALYFMASDPVHGLELRRLVEDGGVELVADLAPGDAGLRIDRSRVVEQRLYFVARAQTQSRLYRVDARGLTDIALVEGNGLLASAGGSVFVDKATPAEGAELYRLVPGTTTLEASGVINPGPASARINELGVLGSDWYFGADDGVHGRELWSMSVDVTPPDIKAVITGPFGPDGTATGDATVTFEVTDGESPVFSKAGCDPVVVQQDTTALTVRCDAESEGGRSFATASLRRDATPPHLECPALITVPLETEAKLDGLVATDASGVPSLFVTPPLASLARIDTTVSVQARDPAGNVAQCTVEVRFERKDARPPAPRPPAGCGCTEVPAFTGALSALLVTARRRRVGTVRC